MKNTLLAILVWLALAVPVWAAISVETGNFVAATGTTTTTVSTGFQGKAVILFTHSKTTEGESAIAAFGMGFADNGSRIGSKSWAGDDAVATTNVGREGHNSNALYILSDGTPTPQARVTGVAFNATPNFVLTWEANPPAAYEISYILFGGDDITDTFVGTAAIATSISTQNITGVGFQPDVVFTMHSLGANSNNAGVRVGLGMAVSASKEWAWGGHVEDGASASAAVNGMSHLVNDAVLYGQNTSNGQEFRADFTQFTGDGFDINVSDAAPANWPFTYLCIKGGQWDLGVEAKPATAIAQTVTGVAFAPKLAGWFMSSATALDTATSDCTSTWGTWDGTNEVYVGAYHNDAINTVAKGAGASTKVLREMNATAEADGTSLNADGWTITWDDTGTAYQLAWWVVGDNATGGLTIRKNVY